MATVEERVRAVVVDKLGVKEESVQEEGTSFVDDLKADSLDLVELIMALEEEFSTPDNPVEIPDKDAEGIRTIGNVVNWLKVHGVKDAEEVAV